mmetsp:Transcript_42311/g.135433  ORF Transcript_42311/g.135433 Transcript_42311/m.135433 type:complete len:221 (-) Transcript_42311:2458-3120(-)
MRHAANRPSTRAARPPQWALSSAMPTRRSPTRTGRSSPSARAGGPGNSRPGQWSRAPFGQSRSKSRALCTSTAASPRPRAVWRSGGGCRGACPTPSPCTTSTRPPWMRATSRTGSSTSPPGCRCPTWRACTRPRCLSTCTRCSRSDAWSRWCPRPATAPSGRASLSTSCACATRPSVRTLRRPRAPASCGTWHSTTPPRAGAASAQCSRSFSRPPPAFSW